MKLQRNYDINQVLQTPEGPIIILTYEDTITYLQPDEIYEMQIYTISFNNNIYYASDLGLQSMDTSLFDKVIAGVGYRGYSDYKAYKKEYNLWKNMLYRCYWQNNNIYNYYGAQGVTVCDRWKCFEMFLYDISILNNYDKFIASNTPYELDIAVKQKNIPINKRIYVPGKVSLKQLYQTDVSGALDACKSMGISSGLSSNIIDDNRGDNRKRCWLTGPHGERSIKEYEYTVKNPPQLKVPSIQPEQYGYIRTPYGLIKIK